MDFQYDTINGAPVAWSDNFILEEEIALQSPRVIRDIQ